MLFIFLLQEDFQIFWLSNRFILSLPDQGYSRNVSFDIIVFIHNFFYHEHVKFWTALHLRFNNFWFHVGSYNFLIYCVTLEQLHWTKSNLCYYNIRVIILIDVFIIRVIYYRIHKSIGKEKKSRNDNWLNNVCQSPWIDKFYISRLKWQREIQMLTNLAGRNEMLYHLTISFGLEIAYKWIPPVS